MPKFFQYLYLLCRTFDAGILETAAELVLAVCYIVLCNECTVSLV